MQKSFSLLELIVVIVIIAIILSFASSKLTNIFTLSNTTNLKSNLALIRNGISKVETKRILKLENSIITELDSASINTKDENLFTKIISLNLISTNDSLKELLKWNKLSMSSYVYYLSKDKTLNFVLENNSFVCKSSLEICKEIE